MCVCVAVLGEGGCRWRWRWRWRHGDAGATTTWLLGAGRSTTGVCSAAAWLWRGRGGASGACSACPRTAGPDGDVSCGADSRGGRRTGSSSSAVSLSTAHTHTYKAFFMPRARTTVVTPRPSCSPRVSLSASESDPEASVVVWCGVDVCVVSTCVCSGPDFDDLEARFKALQNS